MEEIWKPWIKNQRYLISNLGRIKGPSGKILTTHLDKKGYEQVSVRLEINGTATGQRVHRMVLETFNPVENMENLTVDHINGNRTNNNLNNLRWASNEENNQYKNNNREDIRKCINQLIQKYGYEETINKLNSLLF